MFQSVSRSDLLIHYIELISDLDVYLACNRLNLLDFYNRRSSMANSSYYLRAYDNTLESDLTRSCHENRF